MTSKKQCRKSPEYNASDKDSSPKSKPNEYCKVSIEEFVARPQIDFDVFVQIAAEKYVKIGYAGNTLPTDQIQRFKQKGLKYLYIPKEDFKKLVEFNLEVGKLIRNKNEVPAEKKMAFLKYTGEVILEKAYVAGVDKESFQEASSLISMTVDVIGRQEETFDLVDLLNSHADFLYAHSLGVSLYAVMIARLMGFETATVFSKLAMAGMFIDIGLKEVDREVLEKPRHRQSLAERKLVETHPARGRDILLEVPSISSDIVQLVYEHHEDQLGQGYPRGINRHNCHPLSKIIQVADTFTGLVLSTPHSPGRPAPEAIKYMKEVYGERLDQKALNALEELFSNAAETTADKAS